MYQLPAVCASPWTAASSSAGGTVDVRHYILICWPHVGQYHATCLPLAKALGWQWMQFLCMQCCCTAGCSRLQTHISGTLSMVVGSTIGFILNSLNPKLCNVVPPVPVFRCPAHLQEALQHACSGALRAWQGPHWCDHHAVTAHL